MAEPHETWLFEETDAGETPGYNEFDWREDVAQSRTDVISRDKSLCSVTVVVDFAKYKSAVRYILGCAYTDVSKNLRRETPAFHPQWPWLYARAITNVTFLDFTGKAVELWEHALYYATYTYAMVTVEFAEVNYEIWEDADVTAEYERYVFRKSKPYSELLQIDGGQMKAYAPSLADLNGKPFVGGPHVLARTEKSMFTLTWKEVPLDFIQDSDGRQPKLEAIQKKINSAVFMGHPVGTLLCEEVDVIPMPSPIVTDAFEGLAFTADVVFTFKRHNPDRGDEAVDKYGWNLLPAPRDVPGAAGERAMSWVYYTHNGLEAGKPLYANYAFAKVFQHHSLA